MDWLTVAQNFGIAVVCLFALSWAVWKVVSYALSNIFKPMVERHVKFLDDLTVGMSTMSQALQTMAVQQGRNQEQMAEMLALTRAAHPGVPEQPRHGGDGGAA